MNLLSTNVLWYEIIQLIVTKFGSRSGPIFCRAGFGYKLFAKVQPAEETRCHLQEKI